MELLRRLVKIMGAGSVVLCAVGSTVRAQQTAPLVFQGVTVVDVTDGRLLPEQTVVVVGNRVQSVDPDDRAKVPAGAQVVNARGQYLIPGLWDMHTHVDSEYDNLGPAFIASGVTGIREMMRYASRPDFRWWQGEVMAGRMVGPRAVGTNADVGADALGIRTPADAQRVVDSLKAAGDAFIKLHDEAEGAITRDVFFAILRAARKAGLPAAGHVPDVILKAEAADSGMQSIEHVYNFASCYADPDDSLSIDYQGHPVEACASALAAYQRHGTWLVPTLAIGYYHGGRLNTDFNQLETLYRLGYRRFLAGTDYVDINVAELLPGISLLEELGFMTEAGLTPLDALQAATIHPAQFLNATDSLGTVAAGKVADLVLLEANPLADIRNVVKIRAVVANGRYFDREMLDRMESEPARLARAFYAERADSEAQEGRTP